jgi:hypothetical protein
MPGPEGAPVQQCTGATRLMPCILSQYLPEMLLAENQQVIQALAAKYSHGSFRT